MTTRLALAVMAKRPQAGEVKTRLCPPLTPEEAAELAHCFLADTLKQVRRVPGVERFVAFSPADAEDFFRKQTGAAFSLFPQAAGDLGARLADLTDHWLKAGFAGVIVIGADLPTLPDAVLHEAREVLAGELADVVLGPADDGGYYLIGLRRPSRALFAGIAWSTDAVLSQTVARADAAGLRTHLLPPWYDVDVAADLQRLAHDLADDRTRAARTRAYLLSLKSFAARGRIAYRK